MRERDKFRTLDEEPDQPPQFGLNLDDVMSSAPTQARRERRMICVCRGEILFRSYRLPSLWARFWWRVLLGCKWFFVDEDFV